MGGETEDKLSRGSKVAAAAAALLIAELASEPAPPKALPLDPRNELVLWWALWWCWFMAMYGLIW